MDVQVEVDSEDWVARIRALEDQLSRILSTTPSSTNTAISAGAVSNVLELRKLDTEIRKLVSTSSGRTSLDGGGARVGPKLPPQPKFNGGNTREFLRRYQRWEAVAGIANAAEEERRLWFIEAMEGKALIILESFFEKTTKLEELVQLLVDTFPDMVNDLTLRCDISKIQGLQPRPTRAQLEQMLVNLELVWARMSDGAFGDQERVVTVVQKLSPETWKRIRDHPVHKNTISTYATFVAGLRALVSEDQVSQELEKLTITDMPVAVAAIGPVGVNELKVQRRPRVDQSKGASFKAKVSCHFCGRLGHYKNECWVKDPSKRPAHHGQDRNRQKYIGASSRPTPTAEPRPKPESMASDTSTGAEDAVGRKDFAARLLIP